MTSQDTDRFPDCRISKSEILRGHNAFGKVISVSNRLQYRFLRCFFSIEKQVPPYICMVGFAVKKARSSVQRNRARRLLREAWRLKKHRFVTLCRMKNRQLRCVFIIDMTRIAETLDLTQVDALMDRIVPELETFIERS